MKIGRVGGELLHADGQTDMTKLIVAFRSYANAPKHFKSVFMSTAGNNYGFHFNTQNL